MNMQAGDFLKNCRKGRMAHERSKSFAISMRAEVGLLRAR